MEGILNTIDLYLRTGLTNPWVAATLAIFMIGYAALAAPKLPPFLASLFQNPLFKILIMFWILLVRNYDPTVALLTAVGFLISMQTLNRYRMFSLAQDLGDMMKKGFGKVVGDGIAIAKAGPKTVVAVSEDRAEEIGQKVADVGEAVAQRAQGIREQVQEVGQAIQERAQGVREQAQGVREQAQGVREQAQAVAEEIKHKGAEWDQSAKGYADSDCMACHGPQPQEHDYVLPQEHDYVLPQEHDYVLPPQPEHQEQVAAVLSQNCQYMGPQGLQYPQGYEGKVYGAEYGVADSEL